ncbi:molybdenum cofactor biosynthesis protein A [compost metagenome]
MNSEFFQEIRRRALAGVKNSQCQKCYLEEEHGLKSERLTGLADYPAELTSTETSISKIRHFEVFIGRTCNLKCHSCHPQLSTKWEEDYRVAQWPWEKPEHLEIDYSGIMANMRDLEQIKIIGGEPALSKKTIGILNSLPPEVRKNVTVEISTNGTHLFSAEVLETLATYKTVLFNISIDGYGKLNEIIRYPSDWTSLEKNVDHYLQWSLKNSQIVPILHCTVSALNVFSLRQLEDWWQSKLSELSAKKPKSRYALLTQPERLYIGNLPPSLKEKALQNLPSITKLDHIRSLLTSEEQNDSDLFNQMLQYCSDLDRIRGTRLKDVVPEIYL